MLATKNLHVSLPASQTEGCDSLPASQTEGCDKHVYKHVCGHTTSLLLRMAVRGVLDEGH